MVDEEASLTVGLGKLAANRNRVGLCGFLRLCVFSSLVRLLITVLQVTSQRRGKLFEVWDNDPLFLFLVA